MVTITFDVAKLPDNETVEKVTCMPGTGMLPADGSVTKTLNGVVVCVAHTNFRKHTHTIKNHRYINKRIRNVRFLRECRCEIVSRSVE